MSTPLGYTLNTPSASQRDTFSKATADRAVTITKAAVQKYINSFLDPKGKYRGFLEATSSPAGLQFVTDISYDDEMKADPNKRKTHLARFFAENTGRLPCVLIIDQGLENVDPGISAIMQGFQHGGMFRSRVAFMAKINVSIMVATLQQEDTDVLGSMMVNIMGVLSDVIGHTINEHGEKWVVRIPLVLNPGQISNVPVEGDTKTQIWTRNLDLTFEYETVLSYEQPLAPIPMPPCAVFNKTSVPIPQFLNLVPNQKIPLGMSYPLMIRHMTIGQFLGVSDPRIALVSAEPPYILQPCAQGSALIYVVDRSLMTGEDLSNDLQNRQYITSIPFQVTR